MWTYAVSVEVWYATKGLVECGERNNGRERVIGRSKVRYKTVRGYKSIYGMLNGLGLTQWVWSGRDGLCIGELVAA